MVYDHWNFGWEYGAKSFLSPVVFKAGRTKPWKLLVTTSYPGGTRVSTTNKWHQHQRHKWNWGADKGTLDLRLSIWTLNQVLYEISNSPGLWYTANFSLFNPVGVVLSVTCNVEYLRDASKKFSRFKRLASMDCWQRSKGGRKTMSHSAVHAQESQMSQRAGVEINIDSKTDTSSLKGW